MRTNVKRAITIGAIGAALLGGVSACKNDSDVVNKNLAKDADNFKVLRRTVFYNGITGEWILQIEGYCSVDMTDASRYAVTCKVGKDTYKKNLLGKSDNVTMFSEQIDPVGVSASHYKIVFKPSTIIPQPEIR
jgi:hypothetical protein